MSVVPKHRCQALLPDGRQCWKTAAFRRKYRGEKEIYSNEKLGLVLVFLCEKHKV